MLFVMAIIHKKIISCKNDVPYHLTSSFMWYCFLHLIWEEMEVREKFPRLGNMISVCIFFKACELKYNYKLCAYSKLNVNAELKNTHEDEDLF